MRTISALAVATVLGSITVGIPEEDPTPAPTRPEEKAEPVAPVPAQPVSAEPVPAQPVPAQPAAPVNVEPGAKLYWDHSGRDLLERNVELEGAEVAITDPDGRPDRPDAEDPRPDAGTLGFEVSKITVGKKPGPYRLWVRVYDGKGTRSEWSEPLDIVIVQRAVEKPGPPVAPQAPAAAPPAQPASAPGAEAAQEKASMAEAIPELEPTEPVPPPSTRTEPAPPRKGVLTRPAASTRIQRPAPATPPEPLPPPEPPPPPPPQRDWKRHTPTGGCG